MYNIELVFPWKNNNEMTLAMAIVGGIGPANVRKQSGQAVFLRSHITLRKWLLIIHALLFTTVVYYGRGTAFQDKETAV